MTVRITNKEMSDLVKQFGIEDSKAKSLFESFMNSKLDELKAEARAEAFKEMKKQSDIDKKNLIESLQGITEQTIAEEKKKLDHHRKDLLNQKLALTEAENTFSKKLADKEMAIQESYDKKLAEAKKYYEDKYASLKNESLKLLEAEKQRLVKKVSEYVNETVKNMIADTRKTNLELNSAIAELNKFITEQVKIHTKEHRDEMKSLEEARVNFIKETNQKAAEDRKKYIMESAKKISTWVTKVIDDELREFHDDIKLNQQEQWGRKIYECVRNEYAKQFFNEDKYANALSKASAKKLRQAQAIAESAQQKVKELTAQNKVLAESKDAAIREQLITESSSGLPESKKSMLRALIKNIPTDQLKSKMNSYINLIMKENSGNSINKGKNDKMLAESKNRVVTGDNKTFVKPIAENNSIEEEELQNAINELANL